MAHESLVILCPVYNDWKAAHLLFQEIDSVAAKAGLQVSILAVDDGSSQPFESELGPNLEYKSITRVSILELGRNLGHQRAIAIGLTHIEEHEDCDAVVVMDADGEDDPRYIPALLDELTKQGGRKVIFAQRTKRSENLVFRCFYSIYKALYRVLTGSGIRVGNYCIIPAALLPRIVLLSEIWNHFSAGILRGRIPHAELPTIRGLRLGGSPQMNFVSLVLHGLSAISIQADTIGARSFLGAAVATGLTLLGTAAIALLRQLADLAIPGWAVILGVLLLLVSMQALALSTVFALLTLRGRMNLDLLPKRDCRHYIRALHTVFPPAETSEYYLTTGHGSGSRSEARKAGLPALRPGLP